MDNPKKKHENLVNCKIVLHLLNITSDDEQNGNTEVPLYRLLFYLKLHFLSVGTS